MLTRAGALCRLFGLGPHRGRVRLFGARDVVLGVGLLRGARGVPWLWARAASDALDCVLLASRGRRARPARLLGLGAAGLTLLDVAAVGLTSSPPPRTS
jgi:hypothetical protein